MKLKLAVCSMLLVSVLGIGAALLPSGRASADPLSVPTTVADITDKCNRGFLGLKPWYYYMPNELGVKNQGKATDNCGVRCFNLFDQEKKNNCGQKQSDVPGIVLVIIDDLLRIAGLAAVIFVIYGAFQYIGSRGNSERAASGQATIINALVGLAIALVAVGLVSFLGNRLGG